MKTKPQVTSEFWKSWVSATFWPRLIVGLFIFGTFTAWAAESCPRTTIKFSEINYSPLVGQAQWVELINTGTESVDARGMEIISGTNGYSLPIDLAEVPVNGLILVYFDGGGANDSSFAGDNLAVLHSTATSFLGNPVGAAELYQVTGIHSADTLADYVAWGGDPGTNALVAFNKRLWPGPGVFIATDPANPPDGPSFVPMIAGGSLALINGGFQVLPPGSPTSGQPNTPGLSAPVLEWPADGLVALDPPDKYWWQHVATATSYELQIAADAGFTALVLESTNTDLFFKPPTALAGDVQYWWHVRAVNSGGVSSWSSAWTFTVGFPPASPAPAVKKTTIKPAAAPAVGPSNSIPLVPLGARKDTGLLAITPGAASKIMCDTNNAVNQGWDVAHHQPAIQNNDLESWWCWAVGITMINHYYGGTLTRDEVLYKVRGDLLHDADAGSSWPVYVPGLFWALNQTNGNNFTIVPNNIAVAPANQAPPAAATVTNWINSGRPIYFRRPGHIMVVRGYKYVGTNFFCEFVNTDNDASTAWWQWNTVPFGGCVVPGTGLVGRNTDARVAADGDGDGVVNFDENVRTNAANQKVFNSDPAKADTDADGISDKKEIASWVFPRDGIGGNINGRTFAPAWGKKAQYTADTDAGGVKDGDEDKNQNGISDKWDTANPGETDVFDPKDDVSLDLVFCIDTTGSMGSYIAGVQANMISIINYVATNFPKYRIAIVGYKDYPDQGSSYLTHIYTAFETNTLNLISTVNSITVNGGGDTPEAVYSGIIECITDPALGGWRPAPVKRVIITMGDAAAHDPEENGYTLASVQAAAGVGGPTYNLPPSVSVVKTVAKTVAAVDTNTLSGAISVFPIWVGSDSSAGATWDRIALATGGAAVHAPSGSDVSAAILSQIDSIKASTTASLLVTGPAGESNVRSLTSIVADASRSFDPNGCGILQYEWDWNGDGTYDETTFGPILAHAYPAGFTGPLSVRITTVGGNTAVATYTLPAVVAPTLAVLSQILNPSIDRQTGLFFQQVVVSNTGAGPINGLIISITNLPPGVWCVSAMGTNAGVPFVNFNGSLASGATLTLTLSYYSPNRKAPVGVGVSIQTATAGIVTVSTGTTLSVRRFYLRPDGKMAIELDTLPGRTYVIEYSGDLTTWKQAQPGVTGTGSRLIWVDSGPPVTESAPAIGARFYRVVRLP